MTRADRSTDGTSEAEGPGAGGDGSTLESFVAQLHSEGVEAGRREAQELIRSAEAEAEEILRRARGEADALKAAALEEAAAAGERGRAELELAVRDAVLQLQAALGAVLRELVTRSVEAQLADAAELKPLVREVVAAYARADAAGHPAEFRIPGSAAKELEEWWIGELGGAVSDDGPAPRLRDGLAQAGFEYQVGGATVEVSSESVVEKLMELVRPGLREVVAEVARSAAVEAAPAAPAPPGLAGAGARSGG